ncbi:hypothetical protein B0H17DRAFT_1155770 [Mycena rosella]|uniref:Phytocyanin domain-containing protein n=1 Tax=Mycena rosella TaxID=1033263 RepID=A0AAD7H1B0_MYCRO|nr:hypothetical protein B0H17DRAFT_1155770 [Mycena rosella]
MVLIAPFIGAAVFLSGLTAALPTSDYSSGSSSGYSGSSDSSSGYSGSSGSSSGYSGSSDSSSGYSGSSGSSNSNYGSSGSSDSSSGYSGGSNYGSSNSDTTSSMMMMDSSSTMMMMDTSSSTMMMDSTSTTMMMDTTSSTMMMETTTSSAENTYATSTYGSGSTYWGGSGYQDCVNQCVAQFGSGGDSSSGGMMGGMGGSYQATATSGSSGSTGTGSTHTVIVAPTKGVFRMVPFATNASAGDTIEFHWGADDHTVTKSSELTPCNKSTAAPVFASGTQNQSFVFTQVVNDTSPTFYYCGTPTHCEKGMFGIINPAQATPGSPTSLGGMMSSMAANDSDLSAYAAYSMNVTASNDQASVWGQNFDMSSLPEWAHALVATNVLYTRAALAMNSEVLKADNTVDLSSVSTTPLMLPMDLTPALNAAAAPPSADANVGVAGAAAQTAAPASAAESSPAAAPKSGAASSVTSSRMLVGAVVVLATIFAL